MNRRRGVNVVPRVSIAGFCEQGAIDMAKTELSQGASSDAKALDRPVPTLHPFRSGSGGGDDGVGDEAEQQAGEHAPGGDLLQRRLAGHRQQLDHDVEDRPGGQAQERDGQGVVDETLPDQRSKYTSPSRPEPMQTASTRPLPSAGPISWWPSASSTGFHACVSTSQSRNTRMPIATAFSPALSRGIGARSRPSGRPR